MLERKADDLLKKEAIFNSFAFFKISLRNPLLRAVKVFISC